MTQQTKEAFREWAIVELMGHRRLAGLVSEQEIAGQAFIRLDVPAEQGEERVATQFYSPSAVYCITPTTEEIARRVAVTGRPEPVKRWELPAPEPERATQNSDSFHDDDEDFPTSSF